MAFERQTTCDGCGTVVNGIVKGKPFFKDHFQVDGKMLLQLMDQRTKWKEWIYLTREPKELLSFCMHQGFPCMTSYIDKKRGAHNFRKQQRLREEATAEHLDRLERSP